jgi:hypothetical protein
MQTATPPCPYCGKVGHEPASHIPAEARWWATAARSTAGKTRAGIWTFVVLLFLVGSVVILTRATHDSTSTASVSTSESESRTFFDAGASSTTVGKSVSARDVVDLLAATGRVDQFCRSYRLLGDTDSGRALAYESFHRGYGDGPPRPRAVFDEAVSRCSL